MPHRYAAGYARVMRRLLANQLHAAAVTAQAIDSLIPTPPLAAPYVVHYRRRYRAGLRMVQGMTRYYPKPDWRVALGEVAGKPVDVDIQTILSKPFMDLLHFKQEGEKDSWPKMLIIAPMSGHYATLLRATVHRLLPEHRVYITDWKSALEVPLSAGKFDQDTQTAYIMECVNFLGPETQILPVCQPSYPGLKATALMHQLDSDPLAPPLANMSFAGPIDARISPTDVNRFATRHSMSYFNNAGVIYLPYGFGIRGEGRLVRHGDDQNEGFMLMNSHRHVNDAHTIFGALVDDDMAELERHGIFRREYHATCHSPGEFFLQTIQQTFKEFRLAQGLETWTGEYKGKFYKNVPVDPRAITRTRLMSVEGRLDEVTGVGQTRAMHNLAPNAAAHEHYENPRAKHYSTFSGSPWRDEIAPRITKFAADSHAALG